MDIVFSKHVDSKMLDVIGRTGKMCMVQYPGALNIVDYFDEVTRVAGENRVYKWNLIFDYGIENMSGKGIDEALESIQKSRLYTPSVVHQDCKTFGQIKKRQENLIL